MKAIRRSLKTEKSHDSRSSHQSRPSLHQKSAIAIIPPKKVIKALYDYEPEDNNSNELAFRKGDFFHVIGREDDSEWYEACNPLLPSAKGLVPVAFFEIIGKQQRQSGQSIGGGTGHDSGFSEKGLTAGLHDRSKSVETTTAPKIMHARGLSATKGGTMVYGLVMYDFQAERPDELDAKAGEAIIVVAQSNPEWFVAKPIGRLGGPGLIPVSFVQIRDTMTGDPVSDPVSAVKAAGVPRVEEWKRTAAEYKNSSISLGQINTPQIGGAQQITQGMERMSLQSQQRQQAQQQQARYDQSRQQPREDQLLAPIKASVPRYCFDNDMYWYIIEAQMSDGRWWELSRYYADFYDFQIALLEKFPDEAGNKGKARSLPFMPGPVAHVTDAISNGRRQNLDDYIKKIVEQPDHIREDILVRKLFAPKPGQDYEIDPEAVEVDYRFSGHSIAQTQSRQSSGAGSSQQNSTFGTMPPPPSGPASSMRSLNGGYQQTRSSQGQTQPHPQHQQQQQYPPLHSQASNLTTTSTSTHNSITVTQPAAPTPATGTTTGTTHYENISLEPSFKFKLEHDTEILAVRLELNADFQGLMEKVRLRLKVVNDPSIKISLKYRDDTKGTTVPLRNNEDLRQAKAQRNMRVVAEFVD
ncbi:bud emergence protein 1 [Lithohypha guttulata]|uniref:Bud emergence protein 1 n=1 Tax=Lithohypha guttulata TaxID=1690604 RepID=A0AAN7T0X5_9EURO|nr:bud emergence protein 1 [Lithohypha guttulata]KAK5095107.1 bud emergence protein 1 [Lithohypha guttulata]